MADKKKSAGSKATASRTAKASKAAKAAPRLKKAKGAQLTGNGRAPRLDEKLVRAIEKRVRKLEGKLTEASKIERKRLRALESARQRRQMIEAALDQLTTPLVAPAAPPAQSPSEAPAEKTDASPAAASVGAAVERGEDPEAANGTHRRYLNGPNQNGYVHAPAAPRCRQAGTQARGLRLTLW